MATWLPILLIVYVVGIITGQCLSILLTYLARANRQKRHK